MFAPIITGFGIVIIVVTLANGGGVAAGGIWLGLVFTGLGARPALSRAATGTRMIDPFKPSTERSPLTSRWLGVPLLFAVAYSAVGFSLYFSLGLVAERGLGLTPLIFLGVGVVFLLNTLTYVEGEAMLPERGGSATFARYAFSNELVSFIAGWAILIDYVIVIALAALSVPHYLTPIWSGFTDTGAGDRHRRAGDRADRRADDPRRHRRRAPAAAGRDLDRRGRAAAGGDRGRPA